MIDIDNLIKTSLKENKQIELQVYRSLKAKILEFQKAKIKKAYTEEEEIKLINKFIKSYEQAILEFSQAGRDDLISQYRLELEVLQKLIPEPLSPEKIQEIFEEYCIKVGYITSFENEEIAIPKKSMGLVIKEIKEEYPTIDCKILSNIVKQHCV